MSGIADKTKQTLRDLGISDEAGVESLVAELRAELDHDLVNMRAASAMGRELPQAAEEFAKLDAAAAEHFRIDWLGRKQGRLGAANDNWLKPAPGPLKRTLGRLLNEVRAYAE